MKTVSHIIQLATPSILAFKTSQCFETEDEIFVQTASIVFLQYDEPAKTNGSKFSFRTIMSVPVDEHGQYDECFTDDYFVLLGKAGDTISRYDNRLLSLTYGWEKSREKPGFTELEAALMKKGINIDTDNIIPAQYLNLVPTIPEEYEKLGSYAMAVSGPAMAIAIGYALKADPMVLFSLAAVGWAANAEGGAGGPLAVPVIRVIGGEVGKRGA